MPNYIHRAMGYLKGELMENFEYKIIDEEIENAEAILNEWKRDYIIKIISTSAYHLNINAYITILLTRERNGL